MTEQPTLGPPTDSGQDLDLAAVYRYAAPLLAGVRGVPMLGTPDWVALDDRDRRKRAALVVAALSRLALPEDVPAELDRLIQARDHKRTAEAISEAVDWSSVAATPSFTELQRRRDQTGPLAQPFDPVAARRWVDTGHSRPEGRQAA